MQDRPGNGSALAFAVAALTGNEPVSDHAERISARRWLPHPQELDFPEDGESGFDWAAETFAVVEARCALVQYVSYA